ncbi:MAG TPA: efflux RND transporter periplasmic adaptor subunit [Archangium sp.]
MSRFAVVVLLACAGCRHEAHELEEKPKFAVTTPLRRSTELTREYVAQVRASQHIEIRALERGYLQGIFVDEGQRVKAGQKMFQLMPLIYQAEVQKAEAEADRARIEYANTKVLADKNVVSPNELALAKANLDKANAELSLASTHRGLTEIRAPFDGIMGLFHARQGSLISEGDLLTTLSDNSTMWVYFNVAEAEYLHWMGESAEAHARPVKLQLADGRVFDQLGKVETIAADFQNETGTIAFRGTFTNPKGLLRHGETGKVLVTLPVEGALLIPQKATFEVLDKKYVYVVDAQHVVHARPITVSAELPQVYLVATGLEGDEQILLEGLRKVRDGESIEPQLKEAPQVLSALEVVAE